MAGPAKKAPVKKATAAKKTVAKKAAPVKKAAPTKRPTNTATQRAVPAKKAAPRKTAPKKTTIESSETVEVIVPLADEKIQRVAREVINGQWNNEVGRDERLRAAGYDPALVRLEVERQQSQR